MDANTHFTRGQLKLTHDFARLELSRGRSEFRPISLRSMWKKASVTCSGKMGGPDKTYHVQIDVGCPDLFNWSGRAHDAYEARNRAWTAWLQTQKD